ncbi:MAG: hypothetical protein A2583_10790 [Bdellovibrionales bacterium RIFOXYD1_FULL_53_11]|nr:MAG: hypothetical protein A2583_10790 [Bdellovibrionales bacterium RIFOXYD1_FULL_53_11]
MKMATGGKNGMVDLFDSKVLLVDDEPDILDILEHFLKDEISRIYRAGSGEDALKAVEKHDIDLAVVDLRMPGMDGITLIKEIKKTRPGMPFIVLTGHGDKISVQEAMRLGAVDYLDKPFDRHFLVTSIKRCVEKIYYERLIKEILELFILHYTKHDPAHFDKLTMSEKDRALKAALSVARMKILNKKELSSS